MTEQSSSRREPDANGHGQGTSASQQNASQQNASQRGASQQNASQQNASQRGASQRSDGGAAWNSATDSWERRAADLASGVQRWLLKTSAKNVRDELGDQVRKTLRVERRDAADVWATATTEPPGALSEAPECAWCPICRAARRVAESRAEPGSGGSVLAGATDVVSGAVRDVLATVDSILSYRPGDGSAGASPAGASPAGASPAGASPAGASPATTPHQARSADESREPPDEPDDRS
jgi:hypothetical protein